MSNSITMSVNRNIPVVANYSALPAAGTSVSDYYWVEAAQGTAWLPGSLGGTYYPKGLYYSNGVTWNHTESPSQATLLEVNAGTNDNKFVTPLTLATSDLATKFKWTLDLIDVQVVSIVVAEAMSIDSITILEGAFTTTITVNAIAYTLTNPIAQGDRVEVTISSPGSLNLNITVL